MLDDLRNSSAFIEDEEEQPLEDQYSAQRYQRRQRKETVLGMTAQQRFVISLVLFMMVCVLGFFGLVLTGSMVLPF